MAYSTQKDFFHVPFMDEHLEFACRPDCVKLKRYNSIIADSAWALDDKKQSKYLYDLVLCETPGLLKTCSKADMGMSRVASGAGDEGLLTQLSSISAGDSLLQCANTHLAEYQKLLNVKTSLENELNVSNERLKSATQENKKIKEILTTKLDANTCKDFYNKVRELVSSGKLNKNEENEMLQIHKKIENMLKAYEILRAENNYIKRLVEKLANRCSLEKIKTEPEQSKDVDYLQKEVDKLRKECIMLRDMEDGYQKIKQEMQDKYCSQKRLSDRDAENIKAIISDRNNLRDKCKSFNQRVGDMQKKERNLNKDLENKAKSCANLEAEMQKMRKYYEDQMQQACFREECLKAQLEDLKEDFMQVKCQAQKSDMLQMEVSCLRNEILKRDMALSDYDCQYKQLMSLKMIMKVPKRIWKALDPYFSKITQTDSIASIDYETGKSNLGEIKLITP
ncbi:uncharacterized protein ACN427_014059 isoform 2-T3 [Glossina fuscipes fuscipes]